MSAFIDSLNLRPQEKRLIVGIALAVFVVLNIYFVFPHFKDYAAITREFYTIRTNTTAYKSMIAADDNPNNGFRIQLVKLKQQEGDSSASPYKEIQLVNTIASQARTTGVGIQTADPLPTLRRGLTNQAAQFFESQSIRISAQAKEVDLINFLYNIGNDPAMIRVRELDLRPFDNNRYQLKCLITLTADYQKTAVTKPTSAKSATSDKTVPKTPPAATMPAVAPAPAPHPVIQPPPLNSRTNLAANRGTNRVLTNRPPRAIQAPPTFSAPPPIPARPLSGQRPPPPANQ
jgi:hypothetical protein